MGSDFYPYEIKVSKETKPETRIKQSRRANLSVCNLVFHKNSYHIEARDTDNLECLMLFIRVTTEFFNGMRLNIRINPSIQRVLSVKTTFFFVKASSIE